MSEGAVKLTKDNFEKEVLRSSMPVIVDFWAAWCGPCKMIAPIIEEINREYKGKCKVVKLNVLPGRQVQRRMGCELDCDCGKPAPLLCAQAPAGDLHPLKHQPLLRLGVYSDQVLQAGGFR